MMSKTTHPRMWTDQALRSPLPATQHQAWPSQQAEWTSQLSPLNQMHLQERTVPTQRLTPPQGGSFYRLLFITLHSGSGASCLPPAPNPLAASHL